MGTSLLVEALTMAVKYGAPAVLDIVKTWNTDKEVTLDDIRKLEFEFKDPESYFSDKKDDKKENS